MSNTFPPRAASLIKIVLGPRLGGRLLQDIVKWESSSGTEWTCERIKSICLSAVQARGGDLELARTILLQSGVKFKLRQELPIPVGPFGVITWNFIRAVEPQKLRKWHALLRLYTLFVLEKTTTAQIRKSRLSIEEGPNCNLDLLEKGRQEFALTSKRTKAVIIRREPSLSRLLPFTRSHRSRGVSLGGDIGKRKYSYHLASLLTECWIPDALKDLNPCEELRLELIKCGASAEVAGHISLLQESGCKARVVAVPNAWVQWLMEPLHSTLMDIIREDPNCAVFDQNRGGYFLQSLIERNRPVTCVDLSSATDRFPLQLQMGFLEGLGLETWADALREISEKEWLFNDSLISYGTGQPMGVYGSWPLFHLTHVHLLRLCAREVGCRDTEFMVLGDDVIISHEGLAHEYRSRLKQFGVSQSEAKSITSSELGQFAGFNAVRTPRITPVYRPFKWKRSQNVVNTCYAFGNVVKGLGSRWGEIQRKLSSTWHLRYPDLSPFLAEESETTDLGMTAYFLGSMVTALAYVVPHHLSDEFDTLWRTHRYRLLGQETVLDPRLGTDRGGNPLPVRGTVNFRRESPTTQTETKPVSELDELLGTTPSRRGVSSDPLLRLFDRAARLEKERTSDKEPEPPGIIQNLDLPK